MMKELCFHITAMLENIADEEAKNQPWKPTGYVVGKCSGEWCTYLPMLDLIIRLLGVDITTHCTVCWA